MKKLILILILFIFSFTSCKTVEDTIPTVTIQKEYIDRYIHDSIFVNTGTKIETRHDTVFIEVLKEIEKWRVKEVNKTDSIPYKVEVPVIKKVNELEWYQETLMYLGLAFLAYIIIKLVIFVIKLLINKYKII